MSTKRIFTVLLASAIAAGCVSCGGGGATSSTPSQSGGSSTPSSAISSGGADSGLNPVGELPISKETQTLSILLAANTLVEDYATNALTQYVEEKCNIKFDFSFLPATEPGDKLAIMISAGETLPDVVNYGLDATTCYRYGKAGAFLPLNDYYENYSVFGKKNAEENPQFNIMQAITSPDGNVYSVYRFTKNNHDEMKYKLWINRTWLKDLGLEMPTTTDEFEAVLKAFKEKDPNGNGVNDEIPLVGGTGWSQDPTINLMNAFVFEADEDKFVVDNGTLSTSYLQPGYKEGLKYMHRLVEEGLLDPVTFTQDNTQLRAMVDDQSAAKVGVFAFSSITLLDVNTSKYVDDYAPMPPLTGPDGVRFASVTAITSAPQWYVTKDCKNPELAFRVGDFFLDPDLWNMERYGVEGKDWEVNAEDDSFINEIQTIWAIPQNSHWHNEQPTYNYDTMTGMKPGYADDAWQNRIRTAVELYYEARPREDQYVPLMVYNDEELDSISEIRSTLQTYVKESKTRFITGDMDIDGEWDAFQKELKNIGVEEFLKVSQEAYDRMYK